MKVTLPVPAQNLAGVPPGLQYLVMAPGSTSQALTYPCQTLLRASPLTLLPKHSPCTSLPPDLSSGEAPLLSRDADVLFSASVLMLTDLRQYTCMQALTHTLTCVCAHELWWRGHDSKGAVLTLVPWWRRPLSHTPIWSQRRECTKGSPSRG